MHVLVTGGTGFVGSHTVAALVKHGHQVRLLARSPDRVEPALEPFGVAVSEVVVGDVTDEQAVGAAISGCQAVVHAANVFSFDPGRVEAMNVVNEKGTELVLAAASAAGLDPIVHVSSFVALLPSDKPVTGESDVGDPSPPYSRSKAAAERIARRFQSEGVPVVTTYPGSVWGPDDPYLGESAQLAQSALKGRLRLLNDGLLPISDVRDVAEVHAAVLRPGRGPRRFLAVGHNARFREVITRLGELAGRNLWSIPVPGTVALATGRAADWARARFGVELGLSYEGPWLVANSAKADSTPARQELGVDFTSLDTTLTDTIKWLYRSGHISEKEAGSLAS